MTKGVDEGNEASFCLSAPEFREILDVHEDFRTEDILETCLSWKTVDVMLVRKLHSNEFTLMQKYSYCIFSFFCGDLKYTMVIPL